MRIPSPWLILLTVGACGVAAEGMLSATSIDSTPDDQILTPQDNRNGWVNPEDLTPMPQCIAQQDPSTWLSTMTGCTGQRCTRHFGSICTHHQWLTQTSCLSTGFSSDVVKTYLPYCSRSVLAKAQLYQWIRDMTDRTWLVDVGDATELQNLSPASLSKGYAAVSVTHNAPSCLTDSVSALSMEPFEHVMASCSFTSTTQHTGRADRPWEYRGDLKSMVALDFETVGYNLTGSRIGHGEYFDKGCFCRTFTMDTEKEPCSGPGHLDWTQEQLWMKVICGPMSLPKNWTDSLKVTGSRYIPIEGWHWPTCVPKRVTGLVDQCATDACGIDSNGYCKVKRTVDRTCICRNMSFQTCGDSCQDFETRIAYVNWLHNLCGDLQDWHGLPDNWRQLTVPATLEMTPWPWTITPSNESSKCPSNAWKLGTFALANAATFLAALHGPRAGVHRSAPWFVTGILIAALQLLANWVNCLLIQGTPGYDDVPVAQLILLWCSMPRLSWLTFLMIGLQPYDAIDFSTAKSCLFAEIILQSLSAYYMVPIVTYGLKHNFYFRNLDGAEGGQSAKLMYAGALLWLVITTLAFVWSMQVARQMHRVGRFSSDDPPMRRGDRRTVSKIAQKIKSEVDELRSWLGEQVGCYWMDNSVSEATSSLFSGGRYYTTMYGTLPVRSQGNSNFREELAKLYAVTAMIMLLLWFAQWLFWGGFIGLSLEEFCLPRLELLTAVWTVFSLAGTTISLGWPRA